MSSSDLEALFNGPAGAPPDGVTPNFDNPPNMTVGSYITTGICLGIVTLMVAVRIYAKVFCLKEVRIPDGGHSLSKSSPTNEI